MNEYVSRNPERLKFVKNIQSPVVYNKDLLAGPTRRDFERGSLLERRARWCWINKCYNNVYFESATLSDSDQLISNMLSNAVPESFVMEH